ncbi:MAG: BamA/TamA family outer membrane protein [Nitrospirota bacterium]
MKKILVFAIVILLHASLAIAKLDPAFTWTTIETPHFLIHYHQGEEEIAQRAAVIAEEVHGRLVPRVKWEPKSRTHMVLVDGFDTSNGITTTFPYNLITLYITPPLGEPGFGTVAYDDWLRLLITHEYTHVLHIDMIYGGLGGVLQKIFGRIYFPNALEPVWMIEGLAVYEETEGTSGGRNRSPGFDMILREAVLEDRFPQMDQATVYPDFWPASDVPYLFGGEFNRYIAQKYGREKLAEISVDYSGRYFPFLVDSTGRRVLLQEYGELWDEWHDELRSRYLPLEKAVAEKGLTRSVALTKRGYHNLFPAFSPDGRSIAYVVNNADEFPGINVMNSDGSGDRKLVENTTSMTSSGGSLAWSPDGTRIYYTKLDIQRNTDLYNDIYFYDLETGREVRITKGLRARDPYPSPDGKRLLFVQSRLGRTRLGCLTLPARLRGPLRENDVEWLTAESEDLYETPRFSPDGARIAVGVLQPGGYKDIWLLDARGNKLEELMHDRAVDGGAVWSPDGKFIYFASDRTGIFNLYAYELATKKLDRMTNVLGGAFCPSPSPDGKTLVFSSYSSLGYDIHQMGIDAASWTPVEPYENPYPATAYADKPVEMKTRPYNPLPTLLPRFWIPWFGYSGESRTLYGFLTAGQDAVERHAYLVSGLYSPQTYRKWYTVNYTYDGLFPTVLLAASDLDGTFSDLLSLPTGFGRYVEREKTLDASLLFPLLKLESQHSLAVGYRRKGISALTQFPPGFTGVVPAEGLLVSGRTDYFYNSAQRYGNSISPEHGRTIELGYEQIDKALGSDFTIRKYTADWHEYVNMPWKHHVLLARGFAGTSQGDVLPQRAFQLGGDNPGDITINVLEEAVFLRGYPANEFRGRKAALASLEYRFPFRDIESGVGGNGPLFLRRLHGALFAEAGNAWDDAFRSSDFKRSVGAEARIDVYFAYYIPLTFRIGFAKALDEKKETFLIFNLWAPALF